MPQLEYAQSRSCLVCQIEAQGMEEARIEPNKDTEIHGKNKWQTKVNNNLLYLYNINILLFTRY